jgi:hypothetical protein
MNAAQRHLARIHELPCVICYVCYGQTVRATEAHHLEFVRGPHSAFATVPVCEPCHDELHAMRRRAFYRAHKLDDVKLLAHTIKLLEVA